LRRLFLAAGLLAALPVCLAPISDPDLPWHLSAGRFMAENLCVPTRDFLSWTKAGQPWIDYEWAAQLVFYGLEQAGGAIALWLFKAALVAALLALFIRLLRLWGMPASWVGCSLPPLALALVPFLDARPEMFSFLFCLIDLYWLERRRLAPAQAADRGFLLRHAALYAAWANIHAGFVVGLALCLLYAIGEAMPRIFARKPFFAVFAEGLKPAPVFCAWFLAALAGTCLNPHGPALYSVFLTHWQQLDLLRENIGEWTAPRLANRYQWPYWGLLLFSYGAFLLRIGGRNLPPLTHILLLLVLSLPASRSFRHTAYVCLIAFPLALKALYDMEPPAWWPRLRATVLGAVLAATALLGFHILRMEKVFSSIQDPSRYAPKALCAYLAQEETTLARLKMYNPYNWGGYMGWTLYPGYQIFMDGRYIFADTLASLIAAEKTPKAWQKFLNRQEIDLVVMERWQPMYRDLRSGKYLLRPFDVYAMPRKSWALIYWDNQAMMLVRRDAVPQTWLEGHEFRILRPQDLQFVGHGVAAGLVPLGMVKSEVRRYLRGIRDPEESLRLASWLKSLGR